MSDVSWPTTGAIPVFIGDPDTPELAGYTTLIMEYYPMVSRFMMSRPAAEPGAMVFCGEALVIERQGTGGAYLAWLVIKGDPCHMPEFWAA